MRSLSCALALAGSALLGLTGVAHAQDMKLHGAATLAKVIIAPNQADIEAKSGVRISMRINGSGNGLLDLVSGKADMAMIAAPLAVEAKIINDKVPGTIDPSALKVSEVGADFISFVVHPSNSVRSLTQDQVKAILSGRFMNWREVGGADAPIQVVCEQPGQGTRSTVEQAMGPCGGSARLVTTLVNVVLVVGQSPNAIGYGNNSSIDKSVVPIAGVQVRQPVSLVTKGEPNAAQAKVIAAVAAHGKK